MARHTVLARQLKRCQLSETTCPATLEQWHQFLERVNRTYADFDQDRYLGERSQEISSKEMQVLLNDLEEAQKISHFGSWSHNLKTNAIRSSTETHRILKIALLSPEPTFEQLFQLVYPDDRAIFEKHAKNAMQHGIPYDIEIRFLIADTVHWVHLIGKPIYDKKDNSIVEIKGTLMDITKRKLAELRQSMEHNVSHILLQSNSINDVNKEILKIVCGTFNWELGVFWSWDMDEKLLKRETIWGKDPILISDYLNLIPQKSCDPNRHFLMDTIFKTHNAYWLDTSKEEMPCYNKFFKKYNIHSRFAFPVKIHEKLIFVLDFFSISSEKIDDVSLQNINSVSNQISLYIERKHAKQRENELNYKLIAAAHRAGMVEVAASVLHNVGNILNSINVSTNLLIDILQRSKALEGFIKINTWLKDNIADFGKYLTENSQGKQLPAYLGLLEKALIEERNIAAEELNSLSQNVQHIKEVANMQWVFEGISATTENILISKQLEMAINLVGFGPGYTIERHYDFNERILLEKVKLLQILANILRNAKDAMIEHGSREKKLILSITKLAGHHVQIAIVDNGIGIPPENIPLIFDSGFTTKKKGHGVGLHNSALLAKEMGGALSAKSDGVGKGATFTLEFPYKISSQEPQP